MRMNVCVFERRMAVEVSDHPQHGRTRAAAVEPSVPTDPQNRVVRVMASWDGLQIDVQTSLADLAFQL